MDLFIARPRYRRDLVIEIDREPPVGG